MSIQAPTSDEQPVPAASLETFSTVTKTLLEEDAGSSTYAELLAQRALQLQRELNAIRTRQNSLVPLNRLPPEILSYIFIRLAEDISEDWNNKKKFSWLRVTHVCRHWRVVALDYAPLWSNICHFVHPEITKLMLDRSKNAPLTIEIHTFTKVTAQYADVLREAFSQTHRWHSVTLNAPSKHAADLAKILADATGPAPLIQRLVLSNNKHVPQSLPAGFLLGGAPALEELQLDSFDMPWNRIPLPSGLVTLTLKGAVTRPPPSDFLEAIQGLTLLQHLTLDSYLPDASLPSSFPLPSLNTLETRDSWTRVSNLLDIIQIPNVKHVEVVLTDFTLLDAAVESCVQMLKSAVQGRLKDLPGLSRFAICNYDHSAGAFEPPALELVWDPQPLAVRKPGEESDVEPLLEVNISFRSTRSFPLPQAIASINTHFNLATISTLTIESCASLDEAGIFVDVFAKLPNLEELSIIATPVAVLLFRMSLDPALSQKKSRKKGSKTIAPYFPALLNLVLEDIDFDDGSGPKDVLGFLPEVIKKRPKPHGIETVDIRACRNFGDVAYNRLKKTLRGVNVEWDEFEDWTTDDSNSDSDDFGYSDDEFGLGFGYPTGWF